MTFVPWVGTCLCGKRCYQSKRDARTAARQLRGRDGRLDVYRCDHDDRYWHIGHQPPPITLGQVARRDWVSKKRGDRP